MTPHVCPVCGGCGFLWRPTSSDPDKATFPYHACGGRGYVVVSDVEHVVEPVFRYEVHST